jgi:hypothetical protein
MKYFKPNKFSFLILAVAIIAVACNKTKQHSKWLTGETWKVNEITIDGQSFASLPIMSFNDCDIYDEICFGNIQVEGDGMASFAWQVREKGSIFELSDQTENVDESNEESVSFCSSFSGVYNINDISKKEMELQSDNCLRYPGKKVVIKLSKQ